MDDGLRSPSLVKEQEIEFRRFMKGILEGIRAVPRGVGSDWGSAAA